MQLSLQNFQQLVQRMAAAVQRSSSQLVDLSVGSMLRAILEANASIGLWLQWLIVQTLRMTRASTSNGADLDSWMADFSLLRQPATAAHGTATFSRLSTSTVTLIPAGTQVKCSGGGANFAVVADPTNTAWQSAANSFSLPVGIRAIDLPIVAQVPGADGNVMAGMITVIGSAVPGLDFVLNSIPLTGGTDAEDDGSFRARFQDYINSRSRATMAAVGYAVSSVQQSMRHKLFENTNAAGDWRPGQFLLVVDDGSGEPSTSLLSTTYAAVDSIRPIGSSFAVMPPNMTLVSVIIVLTSDGMSPNPATVSAVINALVLYINQLPIGGTLSVTRIAEVAYRASRMSQNISNILVNGATTDLVCSPRGVLRAGSVTVQ